MITKEQHVYINSSNAHMRSLGEIKHNSPNNIVPSGRRAQTEEYVYLCSRKELGREGPLLKKRTPSLESHFFVLNVILFEKDFI